MRRVSATCFNPQGGALGVPNLCTNQAGAVFANGESGVSLEEVFIRATGGSER